MSVDKAKYSQSNDYNNYIDDVQKEYDASIKDYANKLKWYSNIRMILTVLIPVSLIIDFSFSKIITIILSSGITFFEYLIRFNMYEKKISDLNNASVNLTFEYCLYNDKVGIYNLSEEKDAFKLYVERTSKIIKDADMDTYNKFDTDASRKVEQESKIAMYGKVTTTKDSGYISDDFQSNIIVNDSNDD